MRARRWVALCVVCAGLALTACGTTPIVAATTLTATPSLDISVPLAIGACDGAGTCYAFGTTDFSSTPTDAGQMAVRGGGWASIPVPTAPNAELTLMACWHGGCLVFGDDDGGNFAWRVHNASVVATSAPPSSDTLVAVTCFASATCGIVTSASGGLEDYSLTTNGGESWGTPVPLTIPAGEHVLSASCSGPTTCVLVGGAGGRRARAFTVTSTDGGTRWSAPTLTASWASLTDLFCSPASCVALAKSNGTWTEVTADAKGRGWIAPIRQPGGSTNALSCGTTTRCLATTESVAANPGVDRDVATKWQPLATLYLPDGVSTLSCSALRCVLVDDAAVAILAP